MNSSDMSAALHSEDLWVTKDGISSDSDSRVSPKMNQLLRSEYGRMVGYVRKKIDDTASHDAEDIVQDVFYALVNRPDFTAPVENIIAFLYQSLRNRIVDLWRTRKKNRSLISTIDGDDGDSSATLLDILFDTRYATDERVRQREMKDLLREALAQLGSEERSVIVATEIHQYSFSELSEMWNIPLNTLLSRKSRGMKKVQDWIRKQRERET